MSNKVSEKPLIPTGESLNILSHQTPLKNRFTVLFSELARRVLSLVSIETTITVAKFIFSPCIAIYSAIDSLAQRIINTNKPKTTQGAISAKISPADQLLKENPSIAATASAGKNIIDHQEPNDTDPIILVVTYPNS